MNGKVRIERNPRTGGISDNKAVYVPKGAKFRAFSGHKITATIITTQSGIIGKKDSHIVLSAHEIDNPGRIVIGDTNHVYKPSYSTSYNVLLEESEDMCDWRQVALVAVPLASFIE